MGVVGLLEAAAALLKASYQPQRTLLLAFGHDEEVGGAAGAAHIAGVGVGGWVGAGRRGERRKRVRKCDMQLSNPGQDCAQFG